VLNARIREVCETCNNGWMSAMESWAEPMLMRLWASTPTFGRTAISVDDAAFLATWAAKTAWMHERVSVWKPTATSEMRSYLMDKQLPPEFTSVWIGRHVGELDFAHFLANFDVSHQDQPWDSSDQRRVLVVAMAFKGLAFAVRTDDGWGVPPTPLDAQRWQRLWPVTEVVPWPPAQVLSDDDVVSVTHYYSSWLRTPDVPNFHRHPGGVREVHRN
jgi:hypothetical protein